MRITTRTALVLAFAAIGCAHHDAPAPATAKADDAPACAFGTTLTALRASRAFQLGDAQTVTQSTVDTVEPYLFDRAFGNGEGDTTLDAIFGALDGGTLTKQPLKDLIDARSYVLYTYSASGVPGGFIAIAGSTAVVARISGDAVTDCEIAPLASCDSAPCDSGYACKPSPIDAAANLCFSCERIALTEVCPAGQSYSVRDCACKVDPLDCTATGKCDAGYTCMPNVISTGKSCVSCARLALTATCAGGTHFDVAACSCIPNN
jgi:hypothetical protein